MKKISFKALKENSDKWAEAVIVFTKDSFDKEYSEKSRSYDVVSSAKFFNPKMNGSSLFGNCLDGTDNGVRLDWYMKALPEDGLGKRWKVEYCYVTKMKEEK